MLSIPDAGGESGLRANSRTTERIRKSGRDHGCFHGRQLDVFTFPELKSRGNDQYIAVQEVRSKVKQASWHDGSWSIYAS